MRLMIRAGSAPATPPTVLACPLTYSSPKTTVTGMGSDAMEFGAAPEPKSTIDVKSGNFNIPSAFGLSRSSFHIWTTANPGESKLDGTGGFCMLRKVGEVWPMSIWFNFKCMPMIGSAVDTRELALASLKFLTDKRTKDVGATAGVWQARPAVTAPASTVAKTPWPGFSAQAPPFRQPDRWL